jgi:hypothetical protein
MQNDLSGLYEKYLMFTDQMCADYSGMEVAAVMMAISLSIYRTSMTEDDYNKVVDSVSESRSRVKIFSTERSIQ